MFRPVHVVLVLSLLSSAAMAGPNDESTLRYRVDALERQLNARGGSGGPAPTGAVGNLTSRIDTLEEQLRQTRGQLEESQHTTATLKKQVDQMNQDVDFRLQALEQNAASAAPQPAAAPAPAAVAAPSAEPAPLAAPTPTGAAAASAEAPAAAGEAPFTVQNFSSSREHYNYGFSLMNKAQYDKAGQVFEAFLQRYPKDPLVSNVYYWLGETFYVREDYLKAADSFRKGFEAMPNGIKAPDNLFKLAKSLTQLGKKDKACIVLQQILVKFKGGAESVLQKARDERQQLACPE